MRDSTEGAAGAATAGAAAAAGDTTDGGAGFFAPDDSTTGFEACGVSAAGVSFSTNAITSPGLGRLSVSSPSAGGASGSGGRRTGIFATANCGFSRSRFGGVAAPGAIVTAYTSR